MAGTPPLRLVYVSVSCLTCGQKRVVMRGKGVGKAERVEMDEWARRHAEKPGHEVHYREIRRRTFNHTPMFA